MSTRKYLFKAKSGSRTWIYGLPLKRDGKTYIIDINDTSCLTQVNPDTLCENTNRLMDDEKTEIYENDVIFYNDKYWVILYCEALTGFQAVHYDEDTDFNFYLPITQVMEGKIKGNIIDNPDLAKVKLE